MQDNEIFVPIKGYEGVYEISNFGAIRSLDKFVSNRGSHKAYLQKGRLLKIGIISTGYSSVGLSSGSYPFVRRDTIAIHRVVAIAFIPNPENKPYINHIDGNKQNNHVSNLEWCTQSENITHAYQVLQRRHGCAKLSDSAVVDIYMNTKKGVRHGWGDSSIKGNTIEMAKKYNIKKCALLDVVNGKTYTSITKHLTRKS